jgi:tetratricopeptide (TPR) repeat protein
MSPAGNFARPLVRKVLILAVVPAMAFMAYWPLRMAWADHLARASDAESVARAVRLSPGDADFRLKLAALQQAGGADPKAALAAAADLDPGNAETWIRLGVVAEMRGDLHTAEASLLEAAHASRQFGPRWALANYYFRRGDSRNFWRWTRASLVMGYGDMNPVFQLCWHRSQDAGPIFERAIPERREVLDAYVQFLLQEGRLAASEPVAAKLARLATTDDQWTLATWCDRQIDAGSVPAAVEVWNTLCARHLLPYAPVDRDRAPLTDGGFTAPSGGDGFAWREMPGPGVTMGRNPSPRYLWVAFSGDQPETCVPLMQFVPVTPGASYSLRCEYQTSELPAASGLRWSVFDARRGMELAAASPWLSNTDWKPEEVRFTAPDSGLVRLTLICQRVQGATRIEGSLELRRLALVAHALAGVPFGPGELQLAALSAEAGSGTLKRAPRGRP